MRFLNDIRDKKLINESFGFMIDDDIEDDKDTVITLSKSKVRTLDLDPFFKLVDKYLLHYNDPKEMNEYEMNIIEGIKSSDGSYCKKVVAIETLRDLRLLIVRAIPLFGNDGNYNWIDTSNVTSFSALFKGNKDWNGDITLWDVSNVTNMNYTFDGCTSFKRDLSGWDTRSLKFMTGCFLNSGYDKDIIKKWNTKKVITKYNIF